MQEQNVITREEAAKYGLRPILGFSSTKQLRQVYEDAAPVHTFHVAVAAYEHAAHQVAQQAAQAKAKGGAQ